MSAAEKIAEVPFQSRVQPWMTACFGPEISGDRLERSDRLLEEVLELLQSGDYPRERIAALTGYVWSRPKGEPAQEVGGVMVTLAAYCLAHSLDMHEAGETELARIWTKIEKIRAKQAAKPAGSALRDTVAALADLADAQAQEIARLTAENEQLRKMLQPEWFYPADGYESETCRFDVYEVLEEDYFWDRAKTGQHVVKINVATSLPSIWAAVRFKCECADPDGCECDNDMIVTEHASEAEARAALGDAP